MGPRLKSLSASPPKLPGVSGLTVEIRYRNPISIRAQCPQGRPKQQGDMTMSSRDLMAGFVRLHVLNHAESGPIFGIGIIERLAALGYALSPGTLYPILHGLERDGLLDSRDEITGNRRRRLYEITEAGQRMLILSKVRLWELFREVFEKELSPDTAGHVEQALRDAGARATASGKPPRAPQRRPARRGRKPAARRKP
jgi:DNA-binding PadR family transcriptional regulator